jgi:two-component system sensor histidine kinase HydH
MADAPASARTTVHTTGTNSAASATSVRASSWPLPEQVVWKRVTLVLAVACAVTVAHYMTPRAHVLLHSIFQHLYYVPIVLGAVFFGWRGGLLTAACTAMCYVPHIHRWGEVDPSYTLNQYSELGSFFLLSVVTGYLADRERGRTRELHQKSMELQRVNRELEESSERVKEADRLAAVGQLAAGLAHEIRHPLASIEGAINVLENPESPEDLRAEFRGIIRKECRRLGGLLAELLDFAKPRKPRLRRIDLAERVPEVVRLARSAVANARIEVHTAVAERLPTVECDEEQIKQIILNLVMNAIQAMPEGGLVTVAARQEGSQVALSVSDEGEGVPNELTRQIFDPFFTTRETGTGLGLAVVHQIVMQHGGRIEVGRNGDRGARFTIYLPIRQQR